MNIVLVAGEASGDQLGAALIRAIRVKEPDTQFAGIGGPLMKAEGCDCWWDTSVLSLMGLVEVISHLPRLIKLRRQLVERIIQLKPDVFIGIDAPDFSKAMKAALREDPDVILLGEMRDKETMEAALTAAETGHLVFTTLHAPGAPETITRLTAEFSGESQVTIRAKLSANLRAVIAQRLLPRKSGEGRVAAVEVMHVDARIRELILDPLRAKEIGDLLKKASLVEGMLSFDEHLFQLVKSDQIDEAEALKHASSATDLKLKIDGFG